MFLITTALEETWRDDTEVLFLGEWCRLQERKTQWAKLSARVLPYHWDDRAQLYADYQYLQEFHERLLQDLTAQLNSIHCEERSCRYWRILIGPWLGYFVQMVFDRWTSIQEAVSQHDLSETIVLTGRDEAVIPNDMANFCSIFVDDLWNHKIYAAILQRFTKVPCVPRTSKEGYAGSASGYSVRARGVGVKRHLAGLYSRAASILTGDRDAFLYATYLPFRNEMRMHLRWGQVPQLWRPVSPVVVPVDWAQRQWAVRGKESSEFEACVRTLIPLHIPRAYLEGYTRLIEQTANLPWPKRPRVIWTSIGENADDVFKAWTAQKVEEGTPLAIGQHGGHYGIGRWMFVEDHAIAVSDSYLSWGWAAKETPKVKPIGQFKAKRPLGVCHAAQARALLVTVALPRYSYWMYSIVVARQWLDYFEDQCDFVEKLPVDIRRALTVRLYSEDYGWAQAARWQERFPGLRLDEGRSDINSLLRESRLYISTYNATTYLESFNMDIPTVIYWNPNHMELRDSAMPYFEELKRVGIFHESPESAARHVTAIWGDVDKWWSSQETQDVLNQFKQAYCYLPDDILDRVECALREIAA